MVVVRSSWCHMLYHAPKGGIVMSRHNDTAKEWGALSARDLNPSYIHYKPKINSRTLQGDTNRAEARIATRGQGGQGNQDIQGAIGQ